MIKKILYSLAAALVLANIIMIISNSLGIVEYRFNTVTSYASRVLILLLIALFFMAIVNVRRSADTDEEDTDAVDDSKAKPEPKINETKTPPVIHRHAQPAHQKSPVEPTVRMSGMYALGAPNAGYPARPAPTRQHNAIQRPTAVAHPLEIPTKQIQPASGQMASNTSATPPRPRAHDISIHRRRRKIQL